MPTADPQALTPLQLNAYFVDNNNNQPDILEKKYKMKENNLNFKQLKISFKKFEEVLQKHKRNGRK